MNGYLGTMYSDVIMDLDEYVEGSNSKAYENLYYRYMRIQFYLNFVTNLQTELELSHEIECNHDWDKQYSDEKFQIGYKNNHYNFHSQSDLAKIHELRLKVKEQMNLTKDFYFIMEEAGLHEFLQLFSILECYLQDLYKEIIKNEPEKFSKKLKLSSNDEKLILDRLARGEEIDSKTREEIFEKAIENHLMQNVVGFLDSILKSLPKELVNDFKVALRYDEFIIFLNEMRELRNLHTHKLGVRDGKYQNVFGMYITDALRGSIYHLVPKLDKLVTDNILFPVWKSNKL